MAESFVGPVQISYWPLSSPADFFTALTELHAQGWRGGISVEPVNGDSLWRISMFIPDEDSPTGDKRVTATCGPSMPAQVIVQSGPFTEAITQAEFDARYSTGG